MNKIIIFCSICLVVGASVTQVHAASTSTATSSVASGLATTTSSVAATTTAATTTTTTTDTQNQAEVEKRVREYFADTPAMIQIARCESNFRQFTDSGMPFRGGAGGGMVGVFQFYEKLHTVGAKALGFDLATLEGNIGYAKHVYKTEGTTPWTSCEPTPTLYDTNTELKIQLMTKLVGLLQELLKLELARAR
jgi:hypothetical protein